MHHRAGALVRSGDNQGQIVSKQLAISAAASIMAMASFAVLSAPAPSPDSAYAAHEKGAQTEVHAPFIVLGE